MDMPLGEPFPGETLRADGWEYRDLPRMTPEDFDQFVTLVGKENIRWLAMANYPDGTRRGQLLVSPKGLEKVRLYSAKNGADHVPD